MVFIDNFNLFILRMKKGKKYSLPRGKLGLNLGSEDHTLPEYVGVDGSLLIFLMRNKFIPRKIKKKIYLGSATSGHKNYEEFEKKNKTILVIHYNLLFGIPFENNSIPNIYTSHFLEHLTLEDGKKMLRECFRIMKKDGMLRICIPLIEDEIKDMENAIKEYKKGDSTLIQKYVTIQPENVGPKNFGLHKKLYGFEELKKILEDIGFKNVIKAKFKKGRLPLVEKLERRDGLIVEAKK